MHLYSDTISAFISRVRQNVREIINLEMTSQFTIKMEKSRVSYKGIQYPLNIIVFEDHSRLGYFDSRTYELGLSKKLMYQAKVDVLKNVIRHELAHFLSYILLGPHVLHGEEFHSLCRSLGWGPEVYNAYANIELENELSIASDEKSEKLIARLKKLMALASSDNTYEAELATLKANQILLEHNLDLNKSQLHNGQNAIHEEEIVYVKRVLEAKRKNAKHVAIYQILKTFFVSPVFNHGQGLFYLEVIGDKTSVELADYVAHFLDRELEVQWIESQKVNPALKGKSSKNSFFQGLALGYTTKIEKQKSTLATGTDLKVIEKNTQGQLNRVYPRIGHSRSTTGLFDLEAHSEGMARGKKLSINPGVESKSSKTFLLSY
jgi:hypothetical protein